MKVEIYGKDNCPNCTTAAELSVGVVDELKVYKMGVDFQIPEMISRIGKRVAEFPQIFVNDEYVGSLKEYQAVLSEESRKDEDLDDLDGFEL